MVWGCFQKSTSFCSLKPQGVGSIARGSQGDAGSLAMLGGTGGGHVPPPEPVGCSRLEQRLTVYSGFTQPCATQDPAIWAGGAESRDGGGACGPWDALWVKPCSVAGSRGRLSCLEKHTKERECSKLVWKENGDPSLAPRSPAVGAGCLSSGMGSIKSHQPFACLLCPVQCLAAGPLAPRGSGSGHLPGCAAMLLAGGLAASRVPREPVPAAGRACWDQYVGRGDAQTPFLPGFQRMGAHGSRAQSQQDLGGSPSGRLTGISQGNFMPVANGDVLMRMF